MSKEQQLLGAEQIQYRILMALHRNYKLHKRKLLSADIKKKEETCSIIFEKEKIAEFLNKVLEDPIAKGIKIYLCAYGDEPEEYLHGEEAKKYKTLAGKIPKNIDHVSQLTIGLIAVKKVGDKFEDYYTDPEHLFIPPVNHGTLCPPDPICP